MGLSGDLEMQVTKARARRLDQTFMEFSSRNVFCYTLTYFLYCYHMVLSRYVTALSDTRINTKKYDLVGFVDNKCLIRT